MKKIILIIMVLLCCYNIKGQQSDNLKSEEITILLQKIENKMQEHDDYLVKDGLFEDPLSNIDYFFVTVKEIAPQLLSDTKSFKCQLLSLLIDPSFPKRKSTDLDIVYLLYNIQIDDYVDVLKQVCELYKRDDINYYIFHLFIIQDSDVSNSIAKYYENKKLQAFFDDLLQDEILITKCESEEKSFKKIILSLKVGDIWNGVDEFGGLKKMSEIQPPILETLE